MVPARVFAVGLAAALAASCSSIDASVTQAAGPAASTVPPTTEPATSNGLEPATADPANEVEPELLALALADATRGLTVSTQPEVVAPTPPSSGIAAPRNPTPLPAQPAVDPMLAYRGLLGTLGPDDFVGPQAPAAAPVAAPNTAPLTGMWLDSVPQREAVVVKIDNSSAARPQVGLNAADILIEEEVEGGITRIAAVYHSNSATVGPVRSGRTTDISFLTALGSPSLVYSGANDVFDELLLRQPTVANYSAARNGGYWRESSRRAPSNLFASTTTFERSGTPPLAQFAFRPYGEQPAWPAASSIRVDFGRTVASWSFNAGSEQWQRTQDGRAHTTDGGQVGATNVVLAFTDELDTGLKDSSGSPVPEFVFVGTGRVVVFSGGHMIEGTWTRPTLRSPAILTDAQGQVIELNPGRTWIELVGENAASWS